MIKLIRRLCHLLAQHMKSCQHLRTRLVGIQLNVVAYAVRGPEPINTLRDEQPPFHDILEQVLCVLEQLPRLLSDFRIIENLGETPSQLPGMKKRRPIDVTRQFIKRLRGDHSPSSKFWYIDRRRCPIDRSPALSRI